jgi:hypothetical protein
MVQIPLRRAHGSGNHLGFADKNLRPQPTERAPTAWHFISGARTEARALKLNFTSPADNVQYPARSSFFALSRSLISGNGTSVRLLR